MLSHHRPASKTPFKRAADGTLMDPSSPHQTKKNVKVEPHLAKLSGSAHGT